MTNTQTRPRRAYRRFSREVWSKHKETIRQLLLDQDKTFKEVVGILNQAHGITVGERQLKRKTEGWGFFKNIPRAEMDKMVRAQTRRREQLGRPTEFRRRRDDGAFHLVPTTKIALHERRMDVEALSPTSSNSSGLPSNIECYTPPSVVATPQGDGSDTTPTTPMRAKVPPEPSLPPASAVLHAAELALEAKYEESARHFRQLSQATNSPWGSVLFEFNADVMEAATHGGCPQTIFFRVYSLLSCYLFRERDKCRDSPRLFYRASQNATKRETTKVLCGLRMNAGFWGSVVVQQRALQIWKPILGSDHPKITALHESLATRRKAQVVNMDAHPALAESENTPNVPLELEMAPSLLGTTLVDEDALFDLGDGTECEVKEQLEAVEHPRNRPFTEEMGLVKFGRARALAGVYYSFNEQYADAQMAFHDSAETMRYETCVEIKMHRMLWDAEHKTRIWDWDGAWRLRQELRKVLMDPER